MLLPTTSCPRAAWASLTLLCALAVVLIWPLLIITSLAPALLPGAPMATRGRMLLHTEPFGPPVVGCQRLSAGSSRPVSQDHAYSAPRDYAYSPPEAACPSGASASVLDSLSPGRLNAFPRVAPPSASFDPASRTLTILGGDANDALRLTSNAGVSLLVPEGVLARIAAPLPAIPLAGLQKVVVEGPVELIVRDVSGSRNLSIHSDGSVTLAEPLTLEGALHVEAARLIVAASVTAARLDLKSAGSLDLAAGAHLTATGPAELRADAVIATGDLVARQVSVQARAIVQAGAFTASDIAIRFAESYQGTATARLDARGGAGGQVLLDGGQAGSLFSSGRIDATGVAGAGGRIDVFGHTLVLVSATVDASGVSGGGRIRVGGDLQGRNPAVRNAAAVALAAGTVLRADALNRGDGGQVIVWSDGLTEAAGSLSARGGQLAGDGGFVELSGKAELRAGVAPDVSAPAGHPGEALLDPKNLTIATGGLLPQFELRNPTPGVGDTFGSTIVTLSGGGIVVVDTGDDAVANDAGAVYLFDGQSGALLSTLTGSAPGDQVGSGGVSALSNGNFVVSSGFWDNGAAMDAGAITWGSGSSGAAGVISSANSLVGSTTNDRVGFYEVATLTNGNYVFQSIYWDNGPIVDAGAVTWGSGAGGTVGAISDANSLVGSTAGDKIGNADVIPLRNGNYVVGSPGWDSGPMVDVGAVTWGSGFGGTVGPISTTNSLVGTTAGDQVGGYRVHALANGNYVVRAPSWDNGAIKDAGAVIWGSGAGGIVGPVSVTNALVGSTSGDQIGKGGVTALDDGNYFVHSLLWDNGAAVNAGAMTWADGTGGVTGPLSGANSLIGSSSEEQLGLSQVIVLNNGNYVIRSQGWDNGAVTNVGAVTWVSATGETVGPISAANSLVGVTANDGIGSRVVPLTNGNYVVGSYNWDNGAAVDAGAVTWARGTGGTVGPVSVANSLVGTTTGNAVGAGSLSALSNGNYVVGSAFWDDGGLVNVGAVTWGDGAAGTVGPVSPANSLVGATAGDMIGLSGIAPLSSGNYVVTSSAWDNGTLVDVGAATWGDGAGGTVGLVSAANSLVGTTAGDQVGSGFVLGLANGNYVVISPLWDAGTVVDVGAVTWGNGAGSTVGPVSVANSLVGATAGDQVGGSNIFPLANGNYIVRSLNWDRSALANAGAVTLASGTGGTVGSVSAANSLVGSSAGEQVGSGGVTLLRNNNYIVLSPAWDNGAAKDAGAITWGSGMGATVGPVSAANSIIDTSTSPALYHDVVNGTFLVRSAVNGGRVVVGFPDPTQLTYTRAAAESLAITPGLVAEALGSGAALTLQASNDLTLGAPLTVANHGSPGGRLTLSAGRDVRLDADLVANGTPLTLIANDTRAGGVVDTERDAGDASVRMGAGVSIDAGAEAVLVDLRDGAGKTHAGLGTAELSEVTGRLTVQGGPLAPGGGAVGTTTVTGSLTLSGGLSLTIGGAGEGQYDRVSVGGAVALGGPLALITMGYTPTPSDLLLLIDNDGSDVVSGAFAGLAEGAAVSVGGVAMTLSYAGGDGNDVTLAVSANRPPVFTSAPPPVGAYGASYSHTFAVDGTPAPTYSVAPDSLPPGLALNPSTGVLSGTPTRAGTYSGIIVSASNGVDPLATQMVTIVVARAPLTATADDKTMLEGEGPPELTVSYSGLVNGDTPSSLDTPVILKTTATSSSPQGIYQIVVTGGSTNNYTLTRVNGTLTVLSAGLHLSRINGTTGGRGSVFGLVVRGFAPGATVLVDVDGRAILRGTADGRGGFHFALGFGAIAPARTYTIRATGEVPTPALREVQMVSTTVTIDPTAARLILPPGSALPTANAMPTVYLPLVWRSE